MRSDGRRIIASALFRDKRTVEARICGLLYASKAQLGVANSINVCF